MNAIHELTSANPWDNLRKLIDTFPFLHHQVPPIKRPSTPSAKFRCDFAVLNGWTRAFWWKN